MMGWNWCDPIQNNALVNNSIDSAARRRTRRGHIAYRTNSLFKFHILRALSAIYLNHYCEILMEE